MSPKKLIVVFVHGWSVTNTSTYGGLPLRLKNEADIIGLSIQLKQIFLGRYISFHDGVRVNDISRAFHNAVKKELEDLITDGHRFICITHSTGGPVIRDWYHRYYLLKRSNGKCPMSHLIMLAPANFGSALAQLGKAKIGRIKSWFGGIEPGKGVLDWLELGSEETWNLNYSWIQTTGTDIGSNGVFPFVITGQYIDRAFYDNLNSYTGELGSDGVVRSASANLESRYIKLVQQKPEKVRGKYVAKVLKVEEYKKSPESAFRIVVKKSHSGEKMGIMRSVKNEVTARKGKKTVQAILDCLQVQNKSQYYSICKTFNDDTEIVQKNELLEVESRFLTSDTSFFHDKFSMVIFRVQDDKGYPVTDFDLTLTAGPNNDPNHLPEGFFADRQLNSINKATITYFFNYNAMTGCEEIKNKMGKVVRAALPGAHSLGIKLTARPIDGFVRYLPCEITASKELLTKAMHPNSTTMVDIQLRRVVSSTVFAMDKMNVNTEDYDFKKTKPGTEIVD